MCLRRTLLCVDTRFTDFGSPSVSVPWFGCTLCSLIVKLRVFVDNHSLACLLSDSTVSLVVGKLGYDKLHDVLIQEKNITGIKMRWWTPTLGIEDGIAFVSLQPWLESSRGLWCSASLASKPQFFPEIVLLRGSCLRIPSWFSSLIPFSCFDEPRVPEARPRKCESFSGQSVQHRTLFFKK